ncbi:MAG: hypothetical protein M1828_006503 [Chrysothrix sp. TS-e1954]|nr:MAG: hypothetical protein M1828_006503 [Chrysothrix sp. TS-e1954]
MVERGVGISSTKIFLTSSRNGDGWGDVPGMTSKLDHMKELGIDVLWVSPIFKSPQIDMGYDISDYKDIDPRYGTLEDVDRLISELKKRDMKLMMDLVVNHTSDQHDWFKESRSSRSSPKRDWYIWKPPKGFDKSGNPIPPNNWSMILGEENSAWTYDEKTKEFFLALFTPEQPDLNWEIPAVRDAVIDVMNFWLSKGCCGFRMDVINHISKHQDFPDAPVTQPGAKYQPGQKWFANGPRLHEFLRQINREALSKHEFGMTVGEMPFVTDEKEILKVVGAEAEELNMIFIFDLVDLDNASGGWRMTLRDFKPREIKQVLSRWQSIMIKDNGWNSVFAENHDNPRSVSRYCDDSPSMRELGTKLIALMSTTLSGTPYIYEGQEIGMRNIPAASNWAISEYKDVETQNYWSKMQRLHPNDPKQLAKARHIIDRKARDHARTLMQWDASPNGGFCEESTTPWMRVNDDYETVNVASQRSPNLTASRPEEAALNRITPLAFWTRALANRKAHKSTFVYGDFRLLDDASNPDLFAYVRTPEPEQNDATFIVVLNFTSTAVIWQIPPGLNVRSWVCGTWFAEKADKPTSGKLELRAWEGLLGICEESGAVVNGDVNGRL